MKTTEFPHRKIWRITYPVLISLLMEHLIGMTDTAFMGHVGEVELGASAIAGIYYMVLYMLGFGFSVGAEILMGRRNGEGQYRSIGNIFFQGSAILMMIAAAVTLLSYTVSPVLLRNILSSPAIYGATMDYINLRIWGLFFSLIACMFRAFYMATTRTSILTLNGIVMVLSNVVLNYIFVFGKLGLPAMGIAGAAIGSTAAEFISVVFFVLYTRQRTDYKRYGMFRFTRLSPLIQRQIFRVSGWTTVQYFISSATWLFFFLAIEHLGERPLAVSNIVRNVSAFFYMFVSAFASTGTAIVSNLMGNGKPQEVMPVCYRIMRMCAAAILPLFLLAMAFPALIMRIFTDNADLSRRRTLHARHAAHLHPQRAGLRPLPRRIGNRQYAPGIPDGARLNDALRHLHLHHRCPAPLRHRPLLDERRRICPRTAGPLLSLPEKGRLAIEEDMTYRDEGIRLRPRYVHSETVRAFRHRHPVTDDTALILTD